MHWIQDYSVGVIISLTIAPRAKRTEVVGVHGNTLKVRVAAPPVDGTANAALLRFLSDRLGVPLARLELITGETGRLKRVRIHGGSRELAARLLEDL